MKITHIPPKNWQGLTDKEFGGRRENSVLVIRYGGYGDAAQSSSLFPLLKEKWDKVCVNVNETGLKILKSDPNVDELIYQKEDQIPNDELSPYWDRLGSFFDKVYNLSGVIEGNLLCVEQLNEIFSAPHEDRHQKLNKNYSEAIHDALELPHKFNSHFYAIGSEHKWVRKQRRKMHLRDHNFVVVIGLSGSSVHKAYPHMDSVISGLLVNYPEARIVMTGDGLCEILELGWEKEHRVHRCSGKWSIRQTIAFAQQADMVIGPETGLLNAVSMDDVPKVCLLSHSSKENLTKHWVNTSTVEPVNIHCFPCHKLHLSGFRTCNRDEETGASICAASIEPHTVFNAVVDHKLELRKSA